MFLRGDCDPGFAIFVFVVIVVAIVVVGGGDAARVRIWRGACGLQGTEGGLEASESLMRRSEVIHSLQERQRSHDGQMHEFQAEDN